MKTKYQNINLFEAATTFAVFLVIVFAGLLVFYTLPSKLQNNILASTAILDLDDHIGKALEPVGFIFEVENDFLREFNVAFIQLTVPPRSATEVSDQLFSKAFVFYKQEIIVTLDTLHSFMPEAQYVANVSELSPQVAGVVLDSKFANSPPLPNCGPPPEPEATILPYTYTPPPWLPSPEKLINIWSY